MLVIIAVIKAVAVPVVVAAAATATVGIATIITTAIEDTGRVIIVKGL